MFTPRFSQIIGQNRFFAELELGGERAQKKNE